MPEQTVDGRGPADAGLWAKAFLCNADGIAVTDARLSTILAVNEAYARLLGRTPAELRGQPALQQYPPDVHAQVRDATRAADQSGSASLQTSQLHRDGSLIPVAIRFASVRDESGQVTHRVETVTDLRAGSDSVTSAAGSVHSAHRFRQLAEAAPAGILLMDAEGGCEYANPCWQQITSLSIEQAQGDGWWNAVHPDDRERLGEAWERLARGEPLQLTYRYRRPGGETRTVQSRARPLRDERGQIVGYIAVDVDATEQLQQRAAIDQFYARLRALAHRLEHLREEQRVELAHKLHSTLRQELTTLKTEIERLRLHVPESATDSALFARVAEQAERCLQELRHIAFELQPPGLDELGLEAAMKRFADDCAAQAGLNVELTVESPADLGRRPAVVMYRTFQEALTNVIRHARAKKVEAHFWVQDGAVRLRVSDDGIGMGEGDRTRSGAFGLLAISERLAELGGTLRVLGVAGRGTTLDASVPYEPGKRQRNSAER
jgi:PAS domain S-box-containing protein